MEYCSNNMLRCILVLLFTSTIATCDTVTDDKDKEKCATDLVGLATCLPYVSGGDQSSSSPPIDCCTGLKAVLQKSPRCICLLVKDRNDPGLGLKINATLALGLPSQCRAPANISACPSLLHLAPNSPDAKVFEDFANSAKKDNATTTNNRAPVAAANSSTGTTTTATSSAGEKSDGGKTNRWSAIEMVIGLSVHICCIFFLIFIN